MVVLLKENRWLVNEGAGVWHSSPPSKGAVRFHRTMPGYTPTPLVDLPALAQELGVRRVSVKDESARFGLPAFKALGVSYALYRLIQDRVDTHRRVDGFDALRQAAGDIAPLTVVTATDGNHGRALARFAALLGIPARVYVPDVVDQGEIDQIQAEQAHVIVVPGDYDGAVALAARYADAEPTVVLVQDTAWFGYQRIPQYIVDGYATMFAEVDEQLEEDRATLVVTPIGVGSLAQAAIAHYKSRRHPVSILGIEPGTAACVYASLRAGKLLSVETDATIMAGLNCGTPSLLAWPYLRDGLDVTTTVSDAQAAAAVEEFHRFGLQSGPCGAAGLPGLRTVAGAAGGRTALGLNRDSVIVLLSTEKSRPASPVE